MKQFVVLIALTGLFSTSAGTAQRLPIHSGQYAFEHTFAEQPNMRSISLIARINGHHIVLINKSKSDVFPRGVIADGELMWHAKSRQWIIGATHSDRYAGEAGGCSDGPEVVDLRHKIYWTC